MIIIVIIAALIFIHNILYIYIIRKERRNTHTHDYSSRDVSVFSYRACMLYCV